MWPTRACFNPAARFSTRELSRRSSGFTQNDWSSMSSRSPTTPCRPKRGTRPGAPRHGDDDVPRDGHGVLAGEGGGAAGRVGEIGCCCPPPVVLLTHLVPRAMFPDLSRPRGYECHDM